MTTETRTQHTPGPWRIEGDLILGASGISVAVTSSRLVFAATEQANARLIAAAPELLSRAKILTDHLEAHWTEGEFRGVRCTFCNVARDNLAAAIAKATGA